LFLFTLFINTYYRNTEYSTELEIISMDEHKDQYIQIPIRLEQCILEGSYKQVMDNNTKLDTNYQYYLHKFDSAIRYQIARSAEKSYESLKVGDAVNLLKFNNIEELSMYVKNEIETNEVIITNKITK